MGQNNGCIPIVLIRSGWGYLLSGQLPENLKNPKWIGAVENGEALRRKKCIPHEYGWMGQNLMKADWRTNL
jgi:hypothetical protein